MADQLSRQKALETARELHELSHDLKTKFDVASELPERASWWHRFTSRDRKRYWRMPSWLWVPVVALLVALFAIALLSAGSRVAAQHVVRADLPSSGGST